MPRNVKGENRSAVAEPVLANPFEEDVAVRQEAAIKIQSVSRRRKVQSDFNRQKEGATRIQALQRGRRERIELKRRQDAATSIQAVQRGKKSRARLNSRQVENQTCADADKPLNIDDENGAAETDKEIAASRIQAMHRGRQSRRDIKDRKNAAARIQAAQRGRKERQLIAERQEAAARIQAVHRGRKDRREIAKRDDAAACIQAVHRGRQERREIEKRREAATKIQSLHRGRKDRQMMGRKQTLNNEEDAVKESETTDEQEIDLDASAAKIQAMQRRRMAKRRYNNERAARTIQAAERRRAARKDFMVKSGKSKRESSKTKRWGSELDESAMKIQSIQRQRMARRRCQKERAARIIQAAERRRSAVKKYGQKSNQNSWNTGWFDQNKSDYGGWGDKSNGSKSKYELPVAKEIDYQTNKISFDPSVSIELGTSSDEFFQQRSFPYIDSMIEDSTQAIPMFAVKQEVTTTFYPAATSTLVTSSLPHLLPPPSYAPPEDIPTPPASLMAEISNVYRGERIWGQGNSTIPQPSNIEIKRYRKNDRNVERGSLFLTTNKGQTHTKPKAFKKRHYRHKKVQNDQNSRKARQKKSLHQQQQQQQKKMKQPSAQYGSQQKIKSRILSNQAFSGYEEKESMRSPQRNRQEHKGKRRGPQAQRQTLQPYGRQQRRQRNDSLQQNNRRRKSQAVVNADDESAPDSNDVRSRQMSQSKRYSHNNSSKTKPKYEAKHRQNKALRSSPRRQRSGPKKSRMTSNVSETRTKDVELPSYAVEESNQLTPRKPLDRKYKGAQGRRASPLKEGRKTIEPRRYQRRS